MREQPAPDLAVARAPRARLYAAARSGFADATPHPPEGVARGLSSAGGALAPPLRFARRQRLALRRARAPRHPRLGTLKPTARLIQSTFLQSASIIGCRETVAPLEAHRRALGAPG